MSNVVFDAAAVLAVLNRETGHQKAAARLYGATISAVNYGEVLKKGFERGGSIPYIAAILRQQRLDIVPFDADQATLAAEIWEACKPYGLSFADRACISLGIKLDLPVLTTDADIQKPDLKSNVELIRGRRSA